MRNRSFAIGLSYVNTALNSVFGLFLSSFLLKTLGDTEYGLYQTMGSFVNYLVLFEFGVGNVMTRNIAMCSNDHMGAERRSREIATIWGITCFLCLVIAVVSTAFYCSLDAIYEHSLLPNQLVYGKKIFIVLTVHLLCTFSCQTLNGYILGCEDYSFSNLVSSIRLVFRTLFLFLFITLWHYSIIIAFVDLFLSAVILLCTYVYATKRHGFKVCFRHFDWNIFHGIAPLCLAIFLQAIVNQANSNVDKFIIGIALGPESVSLYSIALYVYSLFSTATTIPISMYLPEVAKQIQSGISGNPLLDTLVEPCRLVVLVGGTFLFGFCALGKDFITLFYGADKLQAWLIALIIMFPMFVNMANGILINVLDVYNKRIVRSYVLLGTTVLNILLTIWWISSYGMIGAALATAICTMLGQVIIMNLYYYRVLKIDVFYLFKKSFSGTIPCLAISFLLAVLVARLIDSHFFAFLLGGLTFVLIEFISLYNWGFNQQEKNMIRNFFKLKLK